MDEQRRANFLEMDRDQFAKAADFDRDAVKAPGLGKRSVIQGFWPLSPGKRDNHKILTRGQNTGGIIVGKHIVNKMVRFDRIGGGVPKAKRRQAIFYFGPIF